MSVLLQGGQGEQVKRLREHFMHSSTVWHGHGTAWHGHGSCLLIYMHARHSKLAFVDIHACLPFET
jgi:hypothetical protein